jgi:hypothetical protein
MPESSPVKSASLIATVAAAEILSGVNASQIITRELLAKFNGECRKREGMTSGAAEKLG